MYQMLPSKIEGGGGCERRGTKEGNRDCYYSFVNDP